jgi:hypothetical protein
MTKPPCKPNAEGRLFQPTCCRSFPCKCRYSYGSTLARNLSSESNRKGLDASVGKNIDHGVSVRDLLKEIISVQFEQSHLLRSCGLLYLKETMFLTWGALGMFMKSELVKKEIRRLASRFAGTSWAASLIVRSRWKRLICKQRQESIQSTHRSLICFGVQFCVSTRAQV